MDGNRGAEVAAAAGGVTVMDVIGTLAAVRPADGGVGLIDQLRELEDLKSAAAALQDRIAVAFDLLQRQEQADARTPASELGAGVAAQVALARQRTAAPSTTGWRPTPAPSPVPAIAPLLLSPAGPPTAGTPGPSPSGAATTPPSVTSASGR